MFDGGNKPVRPPLKHAPQASGFSTPGSATGNGDGRDPAIFGPLDAAVAEEARLDKEAQPARRKRQPRAHPQAGDAGPRKKRPRRARKPARPESEAFTAAKEMAARAAHDIRSQYGEQLTRDECQKLVSAFRAGVVPRRKAGRRPKPHVTAAYLDWKAGMRGVQLFEKHIPGWRKHNRYHRIGEQKELMDAIRSRRRREQTAPYKS